SGQFGGAHETQLRKGGTSGLQQMRYLVEGLPQGGLIADEVQAMNLDERRAPRPRLRAKILDRTLVRLSERRFEITVAHDIRHAERARCRVEVAALAGDDAALC